MTALTLQELNQILHIINIPLGKYPVFIETGTYEAETTVTLQPLFDELYTIEIDSSLHRECLETCKSYENIHCIMGDSLDVLPYLLQTISQPAFFWLDGHWSKGKTGKGRIECPLLEELELIYTHFKNDGIIVIDDLRLFGGGPSVPTHYVDIDWSHITIDSICKQLKGRIENIWMVGDRVVIHLKSK